MPPEEPPAAVRVAAVRGLLLVRQGRGGKGLRPETVALAERLAAGAPVDYAEARRVAAWFARFTTNGPFQKSRAARPDGPAATAWLLHGGDAGGEWARAARDYLAPLFTV